jgi:hypothetical protein
MDTKNTLIVPLQGELVACETVMDAIAIKTADGILNSPDLPGFEPAELERLAQVLIKHGCHGTAQRITANVSRMRAAKLVCQGSR